MNYKEVIEAKYSREAWQGLLYDIFHNKVKFWRTGIFGLLTQLQVSLSRTTLPLKMMTEKI